MEMKIPKFFYSILYYILMEYKRNTLQKLVTIKQSFMINWSNYSETLYVKITFEIIANVSSS